MNRLTLLLLAVILSACTTSSGPIHRYVLETGSGSGELNSDVISIRLRQFDLARYLAQPSLTLLRGDHGIYYASQHVWAEPLEAGFVRALAHDINLEGRARLLQVTEPSAASSNYELQLEIDNFTATAASDVVLTGKFWMFSQGELVVARAFDLSTPLTADGYTHAVERQRTLVTDLAKLIVEALPSRQ